MTKFVEEAYGSFHYIDVSTDDNYDHIFIKNIIREKNMHYEDVDFIYYLHKDDYYYVKTKYRSRTINQILHE
jgi:hypothetical protein